MALRDIKSARLLIADGSEELWRTLMLVDFPDIHRSSQVRTCESHGNCLQGTNGNQDWDGIIMGAPWNPDLQLGWLMVIHRRITPISCRSHEKAREFHHVLVWTLLAEWQQVVMIPFLPYEPNSSQPYCYLSFLFLPLILVNHSCPTLLNNLLVIENQPCHQHASTVTRLVVTPGGPPRTPCERGALSWPPESSTALAVPKAAARSRGQASGVDHDKPLMVND